MSLATKKAFATAAYPLDEVSGNAIDAVGSLDLTENGTGGIGTGTGKVTSTARDFESSDDDYFSHASNAAFQFGDIECMLRLWVKLESKDANQTIITKDDGASGEYFLRYRTGTDRFDFVVYGSSGYGDQGFVQADTLGSPSTGTWYLIHAWHDPAANKLYISVNAQATPDESAHSAGIYVGTGEFRISTHTIQQYDGLMNDMVVMKNAFLDGSERTADYNGGTGVAFSAWDAGGSQDVPELFSLRKNQHKQIIIR